MEIKNQTTYDGRPNEEVRFGMYYPCIVVSISDDKEMVRLPFLDGKYEWIVPSTEIIRGGRIGA